MGTIFSTLRAEAERVSEANMLAMADAKGRGSSVADHYSGQTLKSRLEVGGLALSGGSMIGLIGVALANQAAVLGTSGLLASASTALAGLGAVTLGTAVLPVATVATLGAAVTGLTIAAVGKVLSVDHERGADIEEAIQRGDNRLLRSLGRDSLGLKDWLKGAQQVLFKGIKQQFFGEKEPEADRILKNDARLEYELDDLFSNTPDESLRARNELVNEIAGEIWDSHGVVVDDSALHEALGRTRDGVTNIGKVVAVDQERGLVIQSIGRGRATVHSLDGFDKMPQVGEELTLSYQQGVMRLSRGHASERQFGVSR